MISLKIYFLKIIKNIFKENFRWVWVLEVVYISYNTDTCVLPDIIICTRPWVLVGALGHHAYVYIRQRTLK